VIGQYGRGLYLEKSTLTAVSILYWRNFLDTPHQTLYVHCLQAVPFFFLQSVSNNGNFIGWTKNIHGSILASTRGISLKLHPCHYSLIA